jgi:hypothetical protein
MIAAAFHSIEILRASNLGESLRRTAKHAPLVYKFNYSFQRP